MPSHLGHRTERVEQGAGAVVADQQFRRLADQRACGQPRAVSGITRTKRPSASVSNARSAARLTKCCQRWRLSISASRMMSADDWRIRQRMARLRGGVTQRTGLTKATNLRQRQRRSSRETRHGGGRGCAKRSRRSVGHTRRTREVRTPSNQQMINERLPANENQAPAADRHDPDTPLCRSAGDAGARPRSGKPGCESVGIFDRFLLDSVAVTDIAIGKAFNAPALVLHDMSQFVRPDLQVGFGGRSFLNRHDVTQRDRSSVAIGERQRRQGQCARVPD